MSGRDDTPTPPARELLASALSRLIDSIDRVDSRLRTIEQAVATAAQEREQHREAMRHAIASVDREHAEMARTLTEAATLTREIAAERRAAREHAEAERRDAREHGERWWDRALGTLTSGPVIAIVSPVLTLTLAALASWLGVPMPYAPPSHREAP